MQFCSLQSPLCLLMFGVLHRMAFGSDICVRKMPWVADRGLGLKSCYSVPCHLSEGSRWGHRVIEFWSIVIALGCCLSCSFYCCDETPWPKTSRGGKGLFIYLLTYLAYMSLSLFNIEGNQDRNSKQDRNLGAGAEAETREACFFCWLAQPAFF